MSSEDLLPLVEGLQAPARARAWLSARTTHLPPGVREDALLITSELVTNAVQHGHGQIALRLHLEPGLLRIEVSDGSTDVPAPPAAEPDLDRPNGRGLLIVAATAADWGVHRPSELAGPAKVVWAELHTENV